MISPFKIKFNKFSSLDLDLWTEISIGDTDNGEISSFLNRESISSERYDGRKRNIHSYKYQEPLAPTITFVKQNYKDITQDETRRILSWLTASDKPQWLEVFYDDSNACAYRLFGNFTTIEQYKLSGGRIIGYITTFEANSSFAYSPLMRYPQDPDQLETIDDYLHISEPTSFSIDCNTDDYNKVIFPKVTIKFNGENVYVPIDIDPTKDDYKMVHNVIYKYTDSSGTDKYYVNIDGNKYELSEEFSASSKIENEDASGYVNKYRYHPGNKIIYKGIVVYTQATTYSENQTYYIDTKGTLPTSQPTSEVDIKNGEYYIVATDDNGQPIYGWEVVANIGTGVQIENTYTLNGEIKSSKTILVGNSLGEEVVLDGENKVISSSLQSNNEINRLIGEDFNFEWIPLAEGVNNFTVIGFCDIKFEWIEPRKVGSI